MPLPTTSKVQKLDALNLLTDEVHGTLFVNTRIIDGLLKWAPNNTFIRTDGDLTCKACSLTLMCDFNNEKDLFIYENMTATFRQLKYDMKRHIKIHYTWKTIFSNERKEGRKIKIKKVWKTLAINNASVT